MMRMCVGVTLLVSLLLCNGMHGMEDEYIALMKNDSLSSLLEHEEELKTGIHCFSRHTIRDEISEIQQKRREKEVKLMSNGEIIQNICVNNDIYALQLYQKNLLGVPSLEGINPPLLSGLTSIDISGNTIEVLPLNRLLSSCSALQRINAQNNQIKALTYRVDGGWYEMVRKTSLLELDLSGNQLQTFDGDALCAACPKLQSLDLSRNPLTSFKCDSMHTDETAYSLSSWKPIIRLVSTGLDENAIKKLKKLYAQEHCFVHNVNPVINIGVPVGTALTSTQLFLGAGLPVFVRGLSDIAFPCIFTSPLWIFVTSSIAYQYSRWGYSEEEARKEADEHIVDRADV